MQKLAQCMDREYRRPWFYVKLLLLHHAVAQDSAGFAVAATLALCMTSVVHEDGQKRSVFCGLLLALCPCGVKEGLFKLATGVRA